MLPVDLDKPRSRALLVPQVEELFAFLLLINDEIFRWMIEKPGTEVDVRIEGDDESPRKRLQITLTRA